jgi:hypothetical protein
MSATTTHVFLGPTLPWSHAREILPGARLLPPAKAGDVYLAVKHGARFIGIVDGVFERVPAVWHKEVLYALAHGVHVYGASSMGALRAAELHPFGMVGVGRIFEAYRDGRCEDDDEVAVLHGPQAVGFAVLTEAMVNVRDALEQAMARGLIGRSTHDVLVREMKRRNYMQRHWQALEEIAREARLPDAEIAALQNFVRRERPNLKRSDAIELLLRLRDDEGRVTAPHEPGFEFEATVFWEQLVASVRTAPAAASAQPALPIAALRSHLGVAADDAADIFQGALLLYLVVREAQRLGLAISAERFEQAGARLMRSLGLGSADDLAAWQRRNALSNEAFTALVEVVALVEAVARHHATGLDAFLPAELQRRGRFEAVAAAIEEKSQALAQLGLESPAAADVGTTVDELLAWYEERFRKVDGPLEEHCIERRFADPARFVREVLAEYVRQRAQSPAEGRK